jgi:hypothetical protein
MAALGGVSSVTFDVATCDLGLVLDLLDILRVWHHEDRRAPTPGALVDPHRSCSLAIRPGRVQRSHRHNKGDEGTLGRSAAI